MNRRPSLRTIALTLVALSLPLTMLAGYAAAAFYKSTNPNDVDITAELAYLRQTMTTAIAAFIIVVAVISGLIVKMYREDGNFSNAKLPLVLLIALVGLLGLGMVVNSYTESVQDQYRRDHGLMTRSDIIDLSKNIQP